METRSIGQYFTISEELQTWVFEKVQHKGCELLEPSFGVGHLLQKFKEMDINYKMTCCELDTSITPILSFNEHQKVIYDDFMKHEFLLFKTIIGNPPYVKQKKQNLYIQFIEKCYHLLDTNGELIFIVPSDFIKLTSASKLINKMILHGSFTDFLFPNNEKLFEGASIDVLIFRYQKDISTPYTQVNGEQKYCNVTNGIITFSDKEVVGESLDTYFHIYVGIVSGKDEVYKVPFGNISVLIDKDKVETFICISNFPSNCKEIDEHLENAKDKLLQRKIKKFTEKNWFEWGALRNVRSIEENLGKPCIYIRNMTRQKEVAFKGTVQHFGGSLLCLIPKTDIDIDNIVKIINSEELQKEYRYAGRFKIGQKQVCNIRLRS